MTSVLPLAVERLISPPVTASNSCSDRRRSFCPGADPLSILSMGNIIKHVHGGRKNIPANEARPKSTVQRDPGCYQTQADKQFDEAAGCTVEFVSGQLTDIWIECHETPPWTWIGQARRRASRCSAA